MEAKHPHRPGLHLPFDHLLSRTATLNITQPVTKLAVFV
jgi:hypothetical protein